MQNEGGTDLMQYQVYMHKPNANYFKGILSHIQ